MSFAPLPILPLSVGASFARQWPVDLFRSGNGRETRSPQLDGAQGIRSASIQARDVMAGDLARLLSIQVEAAERLAWVPFFPLAVTTTSAPSSGTVQAAGIPYGIHVGAAVAIIAPGGRVAAVGNVTSITGGITINPAPSPSDFPAGSVVAPAFLGFAAGPIGRVYTLDGNAVADVSFEELEPTVAPTAALPSTYLGLWVFGEGSGWLAMAPRVEASLPASSRSAMVGTPFQRRTRTLAEPLEFAPELSLFLRAPFETGLVYAMQDALGGQLGRLWVRSYAGEIQGAIVSGNDIIIPDGGQARLYDRNTRHVWSRAASTGHKITAVDDSTPGQLALTLDPAPTQGGAYDLLLLCRLASDVLAMSQSAASPVHWDCSLAFRELPAEYADVEAP